MQKLSLLLLAASASGSEFHEIVKSVNLANAGWTAAVPTRFNSTADVAALCGTFLKGHPRYTSNNIPKSTLEPMLGVPKSFDGRTAFPKCPLIAHVRDQSACGSCWAFGSTETFEGRHCVSTGKNIFRSTEDTTACCKEDASGCLGGQPELALIWMLYTGVVTGGDYGDSKHGCLPYSLAPCAHNVTSKKYQPCPTTDYPSPQCTSTCQNGYAKSYADDKQNGGKISWVRGASQMKTALLKGPLSTAFNVYADFPAYKSGVYKHTSGEALGGHAVSIVGYGTEDGTEYWLVKNSWNEEWGDGGFFKIAHGECGIDDYPTAIDF